MKLMFEYGQGLMEAELPENTDVFVPGKTVSDPPVMENIFEGTKKSIRNPIGMPPISKIVKPGMKVSIVFPDRVKGGFHETSHRKVSIPIIIDEMLKAGVKKKDIKLICSNGLHRKNTREEINSLLDPKTFNDFWWTNQISNHDSEDYDNLTDLGFDEMGNRVIINKEVSSA